MEDHHMPETLETIAMKLTALDAKTETIAVGLRDRIDAVAASVTALGAGINADMATLRTSVDEQFEKAERQRDELKSSLEIKIEAVDDKVTRIYDEVITHRQDLGANRRAHAAFTKRLDDHDVRILALESRKKRPSLNRRRNPPLSLVQRRSASGRKALDF